MSTKKRHSSVLPRQNEEVVAIKQALTVFLYAPSEEHREQLGKLLDAFLKERRRA